MERDVRVHKAAAKSYISTHTLTWSVTVLSTNWRRLKIISTHTLTWSVTMNINPEIFKFMHFNSHAHVERDRQVRQA